MPIFMVNILAYNPENKLGYFGVMVTKFEFRNIKIRYKIRWGKYYRMFNSNACKRVRDKTEYHSGSCR